MPGSPPSAAETTVLGPPSSPSTERSSVLGPRSSLYLALTLFATLWLDLIRQLSYTWETDDQYAYGWFVPILALGLFLKKWPSRPPTPAQSANPGFGNSPRMRGFRFQVSFLIPFFVFLIALLLLPLRVIHEINADWPLITRLHLLLVIALSFHAVFLMGGWRTVKYFAFPICFIVIASRWPSRIEIPLTQGLMATATSLTVELLGWLDIPALQRGNLIELSTGVVGVDEACSGIRSFQSTVMAGLFLGELYLLRWPFRLLLIAVGLPVAFALNVVRTLFLSSQAASTGLSAVDKWHDSAGMAIFLITFGCIWLLALVINRSNQKRKISGDLYSQPSNLNPQLPQSTSDLRPLPSDAAPSSNLAQPPSDPQVSAFIPHPSLRASDLRPQSSVSRYMLAVGCWTLSVLLFTELWYRAHDKDDKHVRWSVVFPEKNPTFQNVELPARTKEALQHDLGTTAKWQEEGGAEWTAYFLRWQGLSMQSMMPARYHRPEVCLTGAGLQQVSESTIEYFDTGHLKLPFRKYTFSGQGQNLFVFFCLWQDGDEFRKGMRWYGREDRLFMALEGRRRYGIQSLEIITSGYSGLAEAERAVRQRLPSLIQIGAL